jgi:DNA repair protein SbcC/Rad50
MKHCKAYFKAVLDKVQSVQNRAVFEYTRGFGPLTSNVQSRLRSVYGFGDIELSGESSEILIEVNKIGSDHKYAPSDYYSESQMQIIMLSMFLTAAITQNWSKFGPILLDDPIEHFDDLNCYSLLDLIRGLFGQHGNNPQIFISTCEERFYKMIRQRFSRSDLKIIYHEFTSIGADGPVIETRQN